MGLCPEWMMKMQDSLGDRMKDYEKTTQIYLPRRTYTVFRVDGKCFHNVGRFLEKPFDKGFADDMDGAAIALCEHVTGARLAYVQSDEISIVMSDFDSLQTQPFFGGKVQKTCSITASIATSAFMQLRFERTGEFKHFNFDSRVFTIPEREEVLNYLRWRQMDATRNSIQMAGHANFSDKQLHGVGCNGIQEMLFSQKGINWNDYPEGFKRGRLIQRVLGEKMVSWVDKKTGEPHEELVTRHEWVVSGAPIFTTPEGTEILDKLVPEH